MSKKIIYAERVTDFIKKNYLDIFDELQPAEVKKIINEAPAVDAVEVDKVAEILCEAIGDECACNVNGNDEWLPEVCELQEECQYPADRLGCWKQFVKHFGERRKDDEID